MSAMSTEPQHARPAAQWDTTVIAAWAILICLGGTQVTFNVASALRHPALAASGVLRHPAVHAASAVHHSSLTPIPVLAGLGPVLAAVLLSHLAASRRAQVWFRCAVAAVMLCSMAVSIGATVEVTSPVFAAWWRAVLFGIVLDAASLLALWFIMDRHGEKASAAEAVEQSQSEARQARAEAAAGAQAAASLEAELAAAKAEVARAEAEAEVLRTSARKPAGTSARKSPRKPGGSSARNSASTSAGTSAPEVDDLSTEVKAIDILAREPGITGSELGRRLGKTPRHGRDLIKRLGPAVTIPDNDRQESR